jgi:tungstate transport system substrate-binding protein
VEAVLAQTGLPKALIEAAPDAVPEPTLIVDEAQGLIERFQAGELDLLLVNDELRTDELLKKGIAASAAPLFHQEVVLVGPPGDPVGVHSERSLEGALRAIVTGDAAFFRCGPCGVRAREEAIFATARALPRRGSPFMEVGRTEAEVVKAMRNSPAYGLLSRPTVINLMKDQEWSLKPLWSGDALQVDTYRLVSPPDAKWPEERRAAATALRAYLASDQAKTLIGGYGRETFGQPLYRPGAAKLGEGVRF